MDATDHLFRLDGRVALVTGARHGIGRAIAVAYARAGARVVITSRDTATLHGLVDELDALGAEHAEVALDLADPGSARAVVEEAAGCWGRLDVLVNNAGASLRRPAAETSAGDWDRVMATNLRGPFLLAQGSFEALTSPGGRVVNLSSTHAHAITAGRAAYAASKAGLEQLTRALAVEWAPRGITVNAIAPGATPTETRSDVLGTEEAVRARAEDVPLGRLGAPEDVVGAALLLASDAGAFITGQTLIVDGGYTLGAA